MSWKTIIKNSRNFLEDMEQYLYQYSDMENIEAKRSTLKSLEFLIKKELDKLYSENPELKIKTKRTTPMDVDVGENTDQEV